MQFFQDLFDGLVGVLRCSLDLNFQDIIERMRNAVSSKSDLTIFEQIDPQQVSDCVILQRYLIGHGVNHFLTFDDLHVLSNYTGVVAAADLHPEILDHCLVYPITYWLHLSHCLSKMSIA